ncbi:hypothetical protein CELD12_02040 [Cellulomonas sp. NTE-D12]|nr:hypothetical protein CELD12_02040 [Cellulomonas sp. NTE-D12]
MHLARDHLQQDVEARLRADEWRRVRRGTYVRARTAGDLHAVALAQVLGVHHQLRAPHVFGHASAALLWGLPLWSVPSQVHVYQRARPGSRRDPTVHRHLGVLDGTATTELAGLPVTTVVRTALDCARSMAPLAGLVTVDGALRRGVDRDELRVLTEQDPRGRGMARARQVIALADPGAESVQESALRFLVLAGGLPEPASQVPVDTRLGTFWADLGWELWRVLLEYDGRPKYTDTEALVLEKRRHDAIVEAGWRVLRVTKEDLRTPQLLLTRVRRLLPADVPLVRRPHLRAR